MSHDLFLGLALFAFVSSITPGPNNLMLMASGANFGLRRTLPHMLGVALGFVAMVLLLGAGLSQAFDLWPVLWLVMKAAAVAYMLWLAWKIAGAAPVSGQAAAGRPLGFFQAAAFQWVNPKAYAMALTAITVYAPDRSLAAVALVGAVFGAVNLPSVGSWAMAGRHMAKWLTNATRLKIFNRTMAGLLVLSLVPILYH